MQKFNTKFTSPFYSQQPLINGLHKKNDGYKVTGKILNVLVSLHLYLISNIIKYSYLYFNA